MKRDQPNTENSLLFGFDFWCFGRRWSLAFQNIRMKNSTQVLFLRLKDFGADLVKYSNELKVSEYVIYSSDFLDVEQVDTQSDPVSDVDDDNDFLKRLLNGRKFFCPTFYRLFSKNWGLAKRALSSLNRINRAVRAVRSRNMTHGIDHLAVVCRRVCESD